MKKTIFKYAFETEFVLPVGAEIVHFGFQKEEPQIWAKVDTSVLLSERYNGIVVGTGHNIPEGYQHLHTTITQNGDFVWHYLYKKDEK